MKEYKLSGFVAPMNIKPCFLIPYFIADGSNDIFAQELDANFIIVNFLRFNPSRYHNQSFFPGPLSRKVGDAGLLGWVDSEGGFVSGAVAHVRESLARHGAELGGAFFSVEAMGLVGDARKLNNAIRGAAATFQNSKLQRRWAKATRKMVREFASVPLRAATEPRRPPASQLDRLVEHLRSNSDDSQWTKLWRQGWQQHRHPPVLYDLALWWLAEYEELPPRALRVLRILIMTSPDDRTAASLARNWLRLNEWRNNNWVPLWLALYKTGDTEDHTLIEIAQEYLAASVHEAREPEYKVSHWINVWSTVFNAVEETDWLVNIARAHVDKPLVPKFISRILVQIVEHAPEKWAYDLLLEWLLEDGGKSATWARVYCAIYDVGDYPDDFVDFGISLLKTGFAGVNGWRSVWQRLKNVLDEEPLWQLVRTWLRRAPINMRIWPDVLVELLAAKPSFADPRIAARANTWLKLGKKHPRTKLIVSFAKPGYRLESKSKKITKSRLISTLNHAYGTDGRISNHSYDILLEIANSLHIDENILIDIVNRYDDQEISVLLTGARQGQAMRFELVLLTAYGESFIEAHPLRSHKRFVEGRRRWLRRLSQEGFPEYSVTT